VKGCKPGVPKRPPGDDKGVVGLMEEIQVFQEMLPSVSLLKVLGLIVTWCAARVGVEDMTS